MRSDNNRAPQLGLPLQFFVPTADSSSAEELPLLAANGSPTQIRQFMILQQLGAGGMGTVYSAYDTKLDRKVALKVLHRTHRPNRASEPSSALLSSQAQRERTLHEAKALARVNHPHVVNIYEVTEADDAVCLAMEFVDGITLRAWQIARARTWREVLGMYLQAGRGLSAVHAAGVVHRDFKPDNVTIERETNKTVPRRGEVLANHGLRCGTVVEPTRSMTRMAVFDGELLSRPLAPAVPKRSRRSYQRMVTIGS